MPELPEVETIRIGLANIIVGKTIQDVRVLREKSFPNEPEAVKQFVVGASIRAVHRRAKVLLIELSTDYTIVTHLKMTGQVVVQDKTTHWGGGHPNDSLVGRLPDNTTRIILTFSDGSILYFNDLRVFGWMKLVPTAEVPNIPFMQKVGPEPLDDSFTADQFAERFARRKKALIKAALLDQTVIAGVGNIYADESLWGAKIHPHTRVEKVTHEQLKELFTCVREVMTLSISKGGSTDKNYVDAEGKRGSYLKFANVFRREGQPCPRCTATIEKIRVAGRGTHICPVEQVEVV
jgi:formamidopyrimidine-DNA glycosylase